jgi:cytochrome b pre-mRNA-processing protein 3
MILTAFRRARQKRNIHALYGVIVAQARSVPFYTQYGVPDTVEGRFELIVLHLVLVLQRLSGGTDGAPTAAKKAGQVAGQELFDLFCRDLDDNLREMGVGDMAVPRRMRSFGEAFYGRQTAYATACAAADDRELEKALARNIFEIAGRDERTVRLARYVRAAVRQLDGEAEDALMAGEAVFPAPEGFAHG